MILSAFIVIKRHITRFYEYILEDIKSLDIKKRKGKQVINIIEIYDSDSNLICVTTIKGSLNFCFCICLHICAIKELFDNYNPCNNGDVIMARSKFIGKCTIKMKMYDKAIQIIDDPRFILSLRKNLILLRKLDYDNYDFSVKNESIELSKSSIVIMKVTKK